jgi:1,4-dihydroxy-2-naphthoate octaprenyltransferase
MEPANDKPKVIDVPNGLIKETKRTFLQTRLSSYVIALRPWSFTGSLIPVALGSCLAYKTTEMFNIWIFLITSVTALSVHAAGNLVNTYYDYKKGVDDKKSDDRTLVDELVTSNDVVTMSGILYIIGCVGFVAMVMLSSAPMEHVALIYFGGLSSSFLYTGGLGLKYIALGDLLILLTFGPLTVLFAFIVQGGPLSWSPLLYTIPLALNTEAVLHSNNARDMECDKAAGIVTLAILLGKSGSYAMFAFLLFMPYFMFIFMMTNLSLWFVLPFLTIFFAFRLDRTYREGNLTFVPKSTAKLNLVMGLCYVAACALAQTLPGLHNKITKN